MSKLFGLILCGGKSSRLGQSKYLIEKEGVALYKWWVHALQSLCDEVYISCNIGQKQSIEYSDIILDEDNNSGPLEGIYRAFQLDHRVNWLVVASDLVYVNSESIQFLVESNDQKYDATCYQNPETGEAYPLFSILNTSIYTSLNNEYNSSYKSVKHLLGHCRTLQLKIINSNLLNGINTVEDYQTWLQYKQK